jgi:hypothetical protein
VQKQQEVEWDAKRGAVSAKRGYGPLQSGENAMPLARNRFAEGGEKVVKEKKAERDDKGDLHPSWLAAKAAKEKKMVKIDIGKASAGMGKKVVFD